MKILTIAATPFFSNRGCHIRIYNEAKYLQKLGDSVEVCTYHNGNDIEGIQTHRIGNVSWYKKTSPGFAWGKLWLDFKLLFLCVKIIRKNDFDIIHAHLFESLVIAKIARFLSFQKASIVLDLQGDLSDEFSSYNKNEKISSKIFIWFSKLVFNWADAVVTSSQNAYEKIKEKYYIAKPFLIVQDGIDLDIFNGEKKKNISSELDEFKKWKGNSNIIFYGGGMSDSKGVGELLGWFIENYQKLNWKLAFFGGGNDLVKYKKLVSDKGLGDKIWFTKENGYFELPGYLELADIGVDPKKGSSESSAKIATYMAAGLPIICFSNDFNKSILGKDGIYINDWEDISSILENFDLENKISYDLDKFSEKVEAEKLQKLFHSLLA